MAKTLLVIRTEVATRLGDATLSRYWSAAEIDGYIREGFSEFCARTGILWKRSNAGCDDVAHQALYNLPTELLQIERVSYQGYRIEPISRHQAIVLDPRFESTEGQVVAWMTELDGLRKLRKVRIPAANGTVDDTQLEYQRQMVAMTLPGHTSELPNYQDKYPRFYALSRAYEREGEGQNFNAADHYMLRFEQGVTLALARKEKAQATRTRILGGRDGQRPNKPARPVLPSNYPRD